jgi:hypothetical protein
MSRRPPSRRASPPKVAAAATLGAGARGVALLLAMSMGLVGCDSLKTLVKGGRIGKKDESVFTTYAADYCRIGGDDPTGKSVPTSCANLTQFLDPGSAGCNDKSAPFAPRLGYFPQQERPVHLCRDLGMPGLAEQAVVRFVVFGDNGAGDDVRRGYEQSAVAAAIAAVCPTRASGAPVEGEGGDAARACDFGIVLGDAIYGDGVDDVWDPLLAARFEDPYRVDTGLRFYVLPGNHDYHGNVTAMIEYTLFSDKWVMPAVHYALPDLPEWLSLYALDTSGLTHEDGARDTRAEQVAAASASLCGTSGWRLLAGHFPPLSHGGHGGTAKTRDAVAQIYAACPFQLYMGGHDHHQEHLTTDQYDVVVQGGGGANVRPVRAVGKDTDQVDAASGLTGIVQEYARQAHGFTVVEATAKTLDLYYFDVDQALKVQPKFSEFAFHCRMTLGKPGCKPVEAH